MTVQWTWRRILLPLATSAVAVSVLGVECQYEPLPDERRGFLGDPCAFNDVCAERVLPDGTKQMLVCDRQDPPTCRPPCDPASPGKCTACDYNARCTQVPTDDGGVDVHHGACVPAALEGEACGDGCADCMLCAAESASEKATCRRQCRPDVDAGMLPVAVSDVHEWCTSWYPDRADTGNVILQNCCPYGQGCTGVSLGPDDEAAVCFGPAPGERGGTCRPGRKCNSTNLVCVPGNRENATQTEFIPDVCAPAGGEDEYCRSNNTCDQYLVCISDSQYGTMPICRKRCQTGPSYCADCGPVRDCVQINGEAPGNGACVPAAGEGQECSNRLCAQCLVCGGMEGADAGPVCRRPCRADIDAGTPDAAGIGPHDWCTQPDPDAGPPIMVNCCPYGHACLTFIGGNGAACYEMGP